MLNDMKSFQPYVENLNELINLNLNFHSEKTYQQKISDALSDQPVEILRKFVPIKDLRKNGVFFTGSKLSKFALRDFVKSIDDQSIILDPACGAGDLLIQCAFKLPSYCCLSNTLNKWSNQIIGRDIFPEFINATKMRIILAAINRNILLHPSDTLNPSKLFNQITCRSGLSDFEAIKKATHIVLNPPFTMVDTPKGCNWTSGKVNSAALFLETCVTHANLGTRIIAILPDVLRSGSRYYKWRDIIESHAKVNAINLYGKCNQWADIPVFIIDLEKENKGDGNNKVIWYKVPDGNTKLVGHKFKIAIGPVVDYRDLHEGPNYPFIKPINLPSWKIIDNIETGRQFTGRVFSSPFVVVRRTSSLHDKCRAKATIINMDKPVAVENHLIVLCPIDGTLSTCNNLIENLKNEKTNEWLNQRMRCRHLTVSSLSYLPWWSDAK